MALAREPWGPGAERVSNLSEPLLVIGQKKIFLRHNLEFETSNLQPDRALTGREECFFLLSTFPLCRKTPASVTVLHTGNSNVMRTLFALNLFPKFRIFHRLPPSRSLGSKSGIILNFYIAKVKQKLSTSDVDSFTIKNATALLL